MPRKGGVPENLIPWREGQSGNPKGRPKKLRPIDDILAEVLGDGSEKDEATAIVRALVAKAKKGDVRAAEILLDRGYGKPKQQVEVQGELVRSFAIKSASGKRAMD